MSGSLLPAAVPLPLFLPVQPGEGGGGGAGPALVLQGVARQATVYRNADIFFRAGRAALVVWRLKCSYSSAEPRDLHGLLLHPLYLPDNLQRHRAGRPALLRYRHSPRGLHHFLQADITVFFWVAAVQKYCDGSLHQSKIAKTHCHSIFVKTKEELD